MKKIRVIDSHTGGPDLGVGPLSERKTIFRDRFDDFRKTVILEPRGNDVLVGALLVPPSDPRCVAGVIFFNNVGYLNMCGHGTIGVGVTLGHLGKITPGRHLLETTVGIVPFEYDGKNRVTLDNVPSYRYSTQVRIPVEGYGMLSGDIAWGGNWFFLCEDHGIPLSLKHLNRLLDCSNKIRQSLEANRITGEAGGEIDHIELIGPAAETTNQGRNFVLCPGAAYDRSPCGTGTSAKLACLHAAGKLQPGQIWRQESIIGSVFEGWVQVRDGVLYPTIRGEAYITGDNTLLVDPADPFRNGIS
jgi:4-hydroxyproline epimerase